MASLFTDFLTALGVRHTEDYSDRRFAEMPFQSMFGLSNLLKEYGIGNTGIKTDEYVKKETLRRLEPPFLIDTSDGFAIVLHFDGDTVTYKSQHKEFTVPICELANAWNGIALLAETDNQACEPDYGKHHAGEIAKRVKLWLIYVLAAALAGYGMWAGGLYRNWAAWLCAVFNVAGLWFSWQLVLKSLGIHTKKADAICSVLEEEGCDEIAKSEASSFMGLFKWSEVGLAYFSVSLLAMLLFAETLPALAAINILCLPYTVWSITYQKFKAKTWCTLCVCVQATLWVLSGCYLAGGWTVQILPPSAGFITNLIILSCCYGLALFALNRLDTALEKHLQPQ